MTLLLVPVFQMLWFSTGIIPYFILKPYPITPLLFQVNFSYVNLFCSLESRAEAHRAAVGDAVADEAAEVEDRVPSAVRIVLRRRPVAVRKALA